MCPLGFLRSGSPVCLAALLLGLAGCATVPETALQQQTGESVVFIGEEPAALARFPVPGRPLVVRSTYLPGPETVVYTEGRDYVVDAAAGTLRRTAGSRLPDFRKNALFGQEAFDHSRFPGFGNGGWFAFVDYAFTPTDDWPVQAPQTALLPATQAKLRAGAAVKLVAFGDSITAGGDATLPEWVFWQRWAHALRQRHPQARITAVNGATGGDSTFQGLERLEEKVLKEQPDLVLVGFGMNDHNVGGPAPAQFRTNLVQIVGRIRAATSAEVVLFSAFPPNPQWKFGSQRMALFAEATRQAAEEARCAYADVYTNWQRLAGRKKPEDLLGNNINHPNDFGHWMYFRVFEALGL